MPSARKKPTSPKREYKTDRLELRLALPILLRRLPGLRLAEPPRYRDAYHFHGLEALRVAW